MSIQTDYGGFDPAFVGITTNFSNPRTWDIFNKLLAGEDIAQTTCRTLDEHFEFLSVATVISHESRHFHDFLLSPYSARVFKLRVQRLLNLIQVLPRLSRDKSANFIPVPLSVWYGLDDDRRSHEMSFLPVRRAGGEWLPISLPFSHDFSSKYPMHGTHVIKDQAISSEDALITGLIAAAQMESKINELIHSSDLIQPWQVFELSGVLVQFQEVWLNYGDKEAKFFEDYLTGTRDNPYGEVIRIFKFLCNEVRVPNDIRLASAMALWSICGCYEKDFLSACPSSRFASLWTYLKTGEARITLEPDLFSLFDHWSKVTGLSEVNDGLRETETIYERLLRRIEEVRAHQVLTALSGDEGAILERVVRGVLQSSRRMISCFRTHPESYVFPEKYLSVFPAEYVVPLLRTMFHHGSRLVISKQRRKELEKNGFLFQWLSENHNHQEIWSMIHPYKLSTYAFLDASDVDYYSTMNGIIDFIFSHGSRERMEIKLPGREFFRKTSLTPFDFSHLA